MFDFSLNGNGAKYNGKNLYVFCIVCREKISSRFEIDIKDMAVETVIKANICRDCFESFVKSYYGRNKFSTSRFIHKIRSRHRDIRI